MNDRPGIRRGDRVRCERPEPHPHSWQRWQGRTGTATEVRRLTPRDELPARFEIGVALDAGTSTTAWFLPTELVVEATADAPRSPQDDETAGVVR